MGFPQARTTAGRSAVASPIGIPRLLLNQRTNIMSIFGSREEDPLLQGDPLAPAPENESSDEEEISERGSSDDQAGRPDDRERGEPQAPASSEEPRSSGETVFSSSGDGPNGARTGKPSSSGTTDTRVLLRSVEEAADGRLTRLNAAIEEGWRLQCVELRDGTTTSTAQTAEASRSLAFVLRRSGA